MSEWKIYPDGLRHGSTEIKRGIAMDGDLISRKALLEKTETIYNVVEDVLTTVSVVTRYDVMMAPAVDAEPVKRARWKPSPVPFAMPICSACGEMGYMNWVACPHCGAKMEN